MYSFRKPVLLHRRPPELLLDKAKGLVVAWMPTYLGRIIAPQTEQTLGQIASWEGYLWDWAETTAPPTPCPPLPIYLLPQCRKAAAWAQAQKWRDQERTGGTKHLA